MVPGCQGDLVPTDSRAHRVRQVAAPEVRRAEVLGDRGEQFLSCWVAGECLARVDAPQNMRRLDGGGLGLDVDERRGSRADWS